jgi:hypothetical protein
MWAFLFKMAKTYYEKLKDPRWQKLRLEVMQRDDFACTRCGDKESTLNVHHWFYAKSGNPWDAEFGDMDTLCEDCHSHVESMISTCKTFIKLNKKFSFDEEIEINGYGKTVYIGHLFRALFDNEGSLYKLAVDSFKLYLIGIINGRKENSNAKQNT